MQDDSGRLLAGGDHPGTHDYRRLGDHSSPLAFSVARIHEDLGDVEDLLLGVTDTLSKLIAPLDVLTPDADEEGLTSDGNGGTTTARSRQSDVLDAILVVGLHERVFLVADAEATFLRLSAAFLGGLNQGSVLVAHDLLGAAVLLRHIELVGRELEAGGTGPAGTIKAVDASELAHVCDGPGVGGSVELVLDLMHVGVPRHSERVIKKINYKFSVPLPL